MTAEQLRVSPKTLVVDDEPDLLETCARLLRQAGHTCLTAHSGREAIALMDAERPHLVVTDFRLPTIDGLAVARHARRFSPPPPVIVFTAYSSPRAKREAHEAGAIIFLAKPFSAVEFLDAVDRALDISTFKEERYVQEDSRPAGPESRGRGGPAGCGRPGPGGLGGDLPPQCGPAAGRGRG